MSNIFKISQEMRQIKEQKIIFRMLRMLAEEQWISLEEEMLARKLLQGETDVCKGP